VEVRSALDALHHQKDVVVTRFVVDFRALSRYSVRQENIGLLLLDSPDGRLENESL